MLFTGEPFDARDAYRLGLFNKIVAHERLMDEARQLAQVLSKKSPQALKMAKKLVKNGVNMDLKSALEFEIQGVSYLSYEAISKQKA
jgi:enoyl-CoA hydratase